MSKTNPTLSLERLKMSKSRFIELFKKGLPYFWDNAEYLLPQETYQALLLQQKNEDSKFKELEKHLKGQAIVEKLGDDFDLLIWLKMILKILPPLSYAQYIDLEVLTKEMLANAYPATTQWENIIKFGKKA